jgi:hypothetical protein
LFQGVSIYVRIQPVNLKHGKGKEKSATFHNIMKASVKGNPKLTDKSPDKKKK